MLEAAPQRCRGGRLRDFASSRWPADSICRCRWRPYRRHPATRDAPVAYITELHGTVKALGNDGSVWTYATNVLNARPSEPPSRREGETGTSGIAVDPATGDVYVSTVFSRDGALYNKIVRLESDDGGRTAARAVDVLRLEGEATDASHQIHGLAIRAGRTAVCGGRRRGGRERPQDDAVFGGKVLRLQRDGSAPADNPRFDPTAPDAPVSFQWAKGLRNVFAFTQRAEDGGMYASENGESIDRLLRLDAGGNYGRPYEEGGQGYGALMFFGPPSVAPVGMAFANGGVFPAESAGTALYGSLWDPLSAWARRSRQRDLGDPARLPGQLCSRQPCSLSTSGTATPRSRGSPTWQTGSTSSTSLPTIRRRKIRGPRGRACGAWCPTLAEPAVRP